MTGVRLIPIALLVVLLGPAAPSSAAPVDCEPARCAVQAALDRNCPCASASNHGRYVSCVARILNRMARDGEIPKNCKGRIRRCAARSICGKPDFVTCYRPTDQCDAATGTCAGDPTAACAADIDCGARCAIRRSAELCESRGGVVGAGGTCCADCVAP